MAGAERMLEADGERRLIGQRGLVTQAQIELPARSIEVGARGFVDDAATGHAGDWAIKFERAAFDAQRLRDREGQAIARGDGVRETGADLHA
ncbi:hypothetical protein D3C71_2082390 [compost metagenome]